MSSAIKGGRAREVIPVPLVPPRKAEFTGEWVTVQHFGKPRQVQVFRQLKPMAERSQVVELRDPETDKYIRHNPTPQNPLGRIMTQRRVTIPETLDDGAPNPDAYYEFVMVPDGHGNIHKNRHFREDPEQVRRREREKSRQDRLDRLLDRFADGDLDHLLDGSETPQETPEASTPTQDAEGLPEGYTVETRGRWAFAMYQGQKLNETGVPKAEALALIADHQNERSMNDAA